MGPYERLKGSLAKGWNTWNTRSVLSHVRLPEGLNVQLGLKEMRSGKHLREALIGRQGVGAEVVRPGFHAYDGSYTELNLKWEDIEITVQSAVLEDQLHLLITPLTNQLMPARLIVECGMMWNRAGSVQVGGPDAITARFGDGEIALYATKPGLFDPHVSAMNPFLALELNSEVGLATGCRKELNEIRAVVERKRREHRAKREAYGNCAEIYHAMQTCLAWDTIYDPKFDRVVTPVSRIWNDTGCKLFCWDTFFAAAMFMTDHKELAYANAVEITRSATASGFVPNYDWSGVNVSADRSQPPVGSMIVWELYRKYKDKWLLEEVFDALLIWNDWWAEHRQIRDGLLGWGSDPYEPLTGNYWETEGVGDTLGGSLESGLDNSPMYDDVPFNRERHTMELADVGLMSLYIRDGLALALIAETLDRFDIAAKLRDRCEFFGLGLQRLWNEEAGIFQNWRTDTGSFSARLSPTNFYPLLTPYVTEKQAQRMMKEHFFNPEEFLGEWMLPSISRNDPAYPDQDYWRGRIWAPMNFLVYLGLCEYRLAEAKRELATKSEALILKEWLEHGHVHENYCGDTGEGCNVANSDRYYHWGALLSLISLMENGYVEEPKLVGG